MHSPGIAERDQAVASLAVAGVDVAGRLASSPSVEVRLIAGTSVSLLDGVTVGTFSDRLFYRLNIIHVRAGDDRADVAHTNRSMDVRANDVRPQAHAQ